VQTSIWATERHVKSLTKTKEQLENYTKACCHTILSKKIKEISEHVENRSTDTCKNKVKNIELPICFTICLFKKRNTQKSMMPNRKLVPVNPNRSGTLCLQRGLDVKPEIVRLLQASFAVNATFYK
jgi:hypothetical protein